MESNQFSTYDSSDERPSHAGRWLLLVAVITLLIAGSTVLAFKAAYDARLAELHQTIITKTEALKESLREEINQREIATDEQSALIKDDGGQTKTPAQPDEGNNGIADMVGSVGPRGATGPQGSSGSPGVRGERGPQGAEGSSGVAECSNGPCLSRQPANPGIQEAGHINISGKAIFGDGVQSTSADFSGIVNAVGFLQNGQEVCDNSGNCSAYQASGNYFGQNGSSFGGLATLGTNDNNALVLETNGSERLRISALGRIGVGTSTPQAALNVAANGIAFSVQDAAQITTLFEVDELNNAVFIGRVPVGSGAGADLYFGDDCDNFTFDCLKIGETGDGDSDILQVHGANGIAFSTSYDETNQAMRIDGNGNVGIGTVNPIALLDVFESTDDGTGVVRIAGAGGGSGVLKLHEGNDNKDGFSLKYDGGVNRFDLIRHNNDTGAVVLSIPRNSSNVGIGTLSPDYRLDVDGDINIASGSVLRFGGTEAILGVDGNGNLVTQGLALSGDLSVGGHVIGNSDTRGQVTVPSGATSASYTFNTAYASAPNIVATPISDPEARYWVSSVTATGFTVNIASAPSVDVTFNFQAQQ